MSRRKSSFRRQSNDEASGLAGWMYTDLLLGLAVVFLGSIGVVVLAGNNSDEPEAGAGFEIADGENSDTDSEDAGAAASGSTTATSSTTTVPVELCSVLYTPAENSNDGLSLTIAGRPSAENMAQQFRDQMLEQLDKANQTLPENVEAFSFSSMDIAIALLYHGSRDGGEGGNAVSRQIFGELKAAFPGQFRDAVGRFMKITNGDLRTTIEVFLVYERPCSQGE
jgi:hypothetical protein